SFLQGGGEEGRKDLVASKPPLLPSSPPPCESHRGAQRARLDASRITSANSPASARRSYLSIPIAAGDAGNAPAGHARRSRWTSAATAGSSRGGSTSPIRWRVTRPASAPLGASVRHGRPSRMISKILAG